MNFQIPFLDTLYDLITHNVELFIGFVIDKFYNLSTKTNTPSTNEVKGFNTYTLWSFDELFFNIISCIQNFSFSALLSLPYSFIM